MLPLYGKIVFMQPKYYITGDFMHIEAGDDHIKIRFPKEVWASYQEKFGFSTKQKLPSEILKKVFLYSFRDFRKGDLSIEDMSAVSLQLLENRGETESSPQQDGLNNILQKSVELAYYVRRLPKDDSGKNQFSHNLNEILQYFSTQKETDFIENYAEARSSYQIFHSPAFSAGIQELYFDSDAITTTTDSVNKLTGAQSGLIRSIRDFQSGELTSDDLCHIASLMWGYVVTLDETKLPNTQESELESILDDMMDFSYEVRVSGYGFELKRMYRYYDVYKEKREG